MSVNAVTDATFETEVYQSDIPVLVEFGTEWCVPCKQIEPSLNALAGEFAGKVKVLKADVDQIPDVAMRLGVRGIPALFVFQDGQVTANRTGAASKRVLQDWLEASVSIDNVTD